MQRTVLDFFAGSGLVSFALSPWFKTIWANDVSEDKYRVFAANLSGIPFSSDPSKTFVAKTFLLRIFHGVRFPARTFRSRARPRGSPEPVADCSASGFA